MVANLAISPGREIDIKQLHEVLGYCSERTAVEAAKFYGIKIKGNMGPCEFCGIGKAKQAPVNKELNPKSSIPGERFFIDISSVKSTTFGGTKYWFGMLDDCTDLFIPHFLKHKSKLGKELVQTIKKIHVKTNHRVKYIRCDDAGENRKAAELYIKEGLNVQFEFTPPGTPQRNGRIERKFATYYGRMRACYEAAKIKDPKIKYGTWAECASTIVKLDNMMTGGNRKEPPYKRFYGKDPPFASSLRTFGELGVVAIHENKDKHKKKKRQNLHVCWLSR
jgi:hypothetical protein